MRQDWKCKVCSYDYAALMDEIIAKYKAKHPYTTLEFDYKSKFVHFLMRWLKRNAPKGRKPEVDHIVPIFKGGESIGLDNHQAICYTCHKAKTSKDLKRGK